MRRLCALFLSLMLLFAPMSWAQAPDANRPVDPATFVTAIGLLAINGAVLGVLAGNEDDSWRNAADIAGLIAGPTAMVWASTHQSHTVSDVFAPLTFAVGLLAVLGVAADVVWRWWLGPTLFPDVGSDMSVRLYLLDAHTPAVYWQAQF